MREYFIGAGTMTAFAAYLMAAIGFATGYSWFHQKEAAEITRWQHLEHLEAEEAQGSTEDQASTISDLQGQGFRRTERAIVPGLRELPRAEIEPDKPGPGLRETMGAAFRLENLIGAAIAAERGLPGAGPSQGRVFPRALGEDGIWRTLVDPDFNPLTDENLAGYEDHAERFAFALTRQQSDALKRQIDREMEDRLIVSAAGPAGWFAFLLIFLVDPRTWGVGLIAGLVGVGILKQRQRKRPTASA